MNNTTFIIISITVFVLFEVYNFTLRRKLIKQLRQVQSEIAEDLDQITRVTNTFWNKLGTVIKKINQSNQASTILETHWPNFQNINTHNQNS